MSIKKTLESDIQKTCIQWLRLKGFLVIRINSGGMPSEYKGKKRFTRFNSTPGCSDVIACAPDGSFTAIEFKQPGKKPTIEQANFLDDVASRNGLAIVAHSLEELQRILIAEELVDA